MMVTTYLGVTRRRRYQPFVYYEAGRFFINGFVFAAESMRNQGELDQVFVGMAGGGQIKYLKNCGIVLPVVRGWKIMLCFSVITVGTAGIQYLFRRLWLPGTAILFFAVLIAWFLMTLNKPAGARPKVWRQIAAQFERTD